MSLLAKFVFRNYVLDRETGKIVNAPYVDNSYKWSGGGMLSTAPDLCRFGNSMLYSRQWLPEFHIPPGYLRPDTVKMFWTPVAGTRLSWDRDGAYGMGWGVVPTLEQSAYPGCCRERRHYVGHTGGAVGASSALVILPRQSSSSPSSLPPQGVVVAIIVNMQSVSLNRSALKIATLFDRVSKLDI